jgi:hypothetical protein
MAQNHMRIHLFLDFILTFLYNLTFLLHSLETGESIFQIFFLNGFQLLQKICFTKEALPNSSLALQNNLASHKRCAYLFLLCMHVFLQDSSYIFGIVDT